MKTSIKFLASNTRDTTAYRNPKTKTPGTSDVQIITRSTQNAAPITATKSAKGKGEDKRLSSTVKIKMKGKQRAIPDCNSDSDFEEHHNDPIRGSVAHTKTSKKKIKEKKVPIGGRDLTTMEQTDEGQELAMIWKQQYRKDSPRPTDVMKTIQSSFDAGLMFKLNFIVLFEFIMDLNEKFNLLMHTKVDAQTVIMKVEEKFPDDYMFKRYGDELAILYNETALQVSTKGKQATYLARCNLSPTHTNQSPNENNMEVLCTPTKLNFDNTESLDELEPLSSYWYRQTTYNIIDAHKKRNQDASYQLVKARVLQLVSPHHVMPNLHQTQLEQTCRLFQ
ncbi:hypothetical protein L6452_32582 [Arctium lappa]|uniref:Uncharacterized protein n=1 Tax=Arctium lappa TaxID=4217 RepID=A0ACB8Z638_ARCLA|nr:hypothetical protein L6452_32582 [Arctium lappa]